MVGRLSKRIIVTGAFGFLGYYTLNMLKERGCEVFTARSNEVDLLDAKQVIDWVQKVQATDFLHLAWITQPGVFFESPVNIQWLEATLNLVRVFAKNGGKRFVGAGTCFEIYGNTFYGFCKNKTREIIERYCEKIGVEFAWGRIYFLYGPYERSERLVPQVIQGLLKEEVVNCSTAQIVRDYMYIEDCARCFVDLATSQKTGIFDVASGQSILLREFILAFAHALERPDLIRFGALADRPNEPQQIVPESDLIWKPQVSLSEGIERTIAYWRKKLI